MLRTAFWNCFQQKRGFSCFRITANRFDLDSGRIAKKCSSAVKTGFGQNGRQTKSSPGRGEFRTSKGLLLMFLSHIGTRKCSKFVVRALKMAVFRGFRGYFGANSGSAMVSTLLALGIIRKKVIFHSIKGRSKNGVDMVIPERCFSDKNKKTPQLR